VAVLIPSIDLLGGKIVQLVQGESKKLEFDDIEYWIERFAAYPLVQLIDLDAARGTGNNLSLVKRILHRLPCQFGGGVRNVETARQLLDAGARRVILGSALFQHGTVNAGFASEIARSVGPSNLVFALDSRGGRVAIQGWRESTKATAADVMQQLHPFCDTFLYTNIDTEGLMQGIPFDRVQTLRSATTRQLIVAGGITTIQEIERLDRMGVDAVVGMAIYTGATTA
jgi:phosphoribosylformimino-5-aminoimidazole carboxamide ribotide isomerase